jgi:hypothetical protein
MKKPASKPITASELLRDLAEDTDYRAMLAAKEQIREDFERVLDTDEESLISDLRAVGCNVGSVWDLVNTADTYVDAIPVLLNHLQIAHHPRTREGIVRALTVPEAKGVAFNVLMEEFLKASLDREPELKWLLAGCLAESATVVDVRRIIELITDPANGRSREILLPALGLIPPDERQSVLDGLSDDPTLKRLIDRIHFKG